MSLPVRADWLDVVRTEAAAWPERPGASASLLLRLATGGRAVAVEVVDGRVTAVEVVDDPADPPPGAVVLSHPVPVARAVLAGEVDPAVSFMRGETKFAGPTGPWVAVQAVVQGDELRTLLAAIRA